MEKKPRHCKDSNKYLGTSANSPPSLSAFVLKTKKMCPCLYAGVQPPKGLQPSHSLSGQHYSGVLYARYRAAQFLLLLLKATRLVGFLRQSPTVQVRLARTSLSSCGLLNVGITRCVTILGSKELPKEPILIPIFTGEYQTQRGPRVRRREMPLL